MMFMMPTPPTTSEIDATQSSSVVISVEVFRSGVLVISVMSRMVKSSSSPGFMWCRSRSSELI